MSDLLNLRVREEDATPLIIKVGEREILRVDADGTFTWGEIDPPNDAIELARVLTMILRGGEPTIENLGAP